MRVSMVLYRMLTMVQPFRSVAGHAVSRRAMLCMAMLSALAGMTGAKATDSTIEVARAFVKQKYASAFTGITSPDPLAPAPADEWRIEKISLGELCGEPLDRDYQALLVTVLPLYHEPVRDVVAVGSGGLVFSLYEQGALSRIIGHLSSTCDRVVVLKALSNLQLRLVFSPMDAAWHPDARCSERKTADPRSECREPAVRKLRGRLGYHVWVLGERERSERRWESWTFTLSDEGTFEGHLESVESLD